MLIDGESTQLHLVKDMLLSIGGSHLVCETNATHSLTVLHNQTFDVIFYKLSLQDMTYEDYMGELAKCEFSGSVALLPDFNSKVFNNVPTQYEVNKVHFLGLIDQPINEEKLVQLLSRVRKLKTHIQE
jgi:two-component SAPR family response regulator